MPSTPIVQTTTLTAPHLDWKQLHTPFRTPLLVWIIGVVALWLLTSAAETASDAAQRILADKSLRDDEARIRRAYAVLLGREPEREEAAAAVTFLADEKGAPSAGWSALVQSLMAGTEFRYVW